MREALRRELVEYEAFHQDPRTRRLHEIGVPALVVSVQGLLSHLHLAVEIPLDRVLWLVGTLWICRLDPRWGFGFAVVSGIVTLLAERLDPWLCTVIFVVAWIIQLYGHRRYEHNQPAITKNLKHVIISPLWIFVQAVQKWQKKWQR